MTNGIQFRMVVMCTCFSQTCIITAIRGEPLTGTAESEVLHTTFPNLPLTLLQNPKTIEYHENRVSFQLVYRIQRFIFIHYPPQTQFEPM
jgi:hypothetical protein